MELTAKRRAKRPDAARPQAGPAPAARPAPRPGGRMTVDGKYFARDSRRFRVHGVTYGPFAPDAAGDPFPPPDRVRDDFARMRDAGINTVRTYHPPPAWVLDRAGEDGIGVL